MADGRKIPYIIELGASDEKLRRQMSQWKWEEIIGAKGKGFGDVLAKEAGNAGNAIKSTLGGLNIDWASVLGAKEIAQLEQAVTRSLKNSKDQIVGLAAKGDTSGIENMITMVTTLGNELKSVGSNFDAAGLARGMSSFMKVLAPLSSKFDALAKEPERVSAAFDKLFSGVSASAKSIDLGKTFDVSGKIKIAMQGLKATNGEILEATESVEKYRNTIARLSGKNPATITLAQDVAGLNKQLDEQMRKEEQLAAQNQTNSAQYAATLKNIIAIENARLKLKAKPTTDYTGMEIREDFGYYEEQINKIVERISQKMTEVEGKLANTVNKSFAEIISKQISDIKLSVSLSEQAQSKFITEINAFVKKVNQSPIEKVRVPIDGAANVVEDKTKRAYGSNPADDDAATTELVNKTSTRFDRIAEVIRSKQEKIILATDDWRKRMINSMSINAKDLEFKFGLESNMDNTAGALFNKLQEYFERPEYALDIKFNTEKIARDLKAGIEAEGITLGAGGGMTNTDIKDLMAMLQSLLGGGLASTVTKTSKDSDTSTQKDVAKETNEAVASGKEYVKVLDETTIHIDKVIESLRAFAKEATKANASKGSRAIANSLTHMGIDIGAIKNGASDTDIITMLQNALMSKDEMGKAQGASLVGKLEGMIKTNGMDPKKGSGKVADALAKDIMELFNINELGTELETELVRRFEQLEIWKGVEKPGKALAALGNVRSTKNHIKIPAIEQIDEAMKYFNMAGEDTASLQKLKDARQKFKDSGETDEAKKEFEKAALVFYDETKTVFTRLKDRWGDFRGVVQAEGRRPVNIDPKGAYPTRILEIPDGAVISKVDIFEVFKTIRDVGLVGSTPRRESSQRKAESEQQRLMRGSQTPNYIDKKPTPKKDVRYEDIEYDKFKTQESGRLPKTAKKQADEAYNNHEDTKNVVLETTIESLEKRAAEIPELVRRIEESKKEIAALEDIKQRIKNEIDSLNVTKLPEFQTSAFERHANQDGAIRQVVKNAGDALIKNNTLDVGDIHKLDNEQQSLVERLKSLTTSISNDAKASQEFANKIAEIEQAKSLSTKELEEARSKAAQQQDKARVDLYGDLLFNRGAVDGRLASYKSQKGALDENIGKNKGYAQKVIDELNVIGGKSAGRATKEAEALATQLIEVKERLYAEAKAYVDILNNPKTDDKTREMTLGKLQGTLSGLDQVTGNFAKIQPYVMNASLYNSSQQKNVDKWNKNYTNKEVNKLEKELKVLEDQLISETDEARAAELRTKITNTKRNLTRLKKIVPDNVASKKQSELNDTDSKLAQEQAQLKAAENQKIAADKAASDLASTKKDVAFLTQYNELLEKERALLEEINRLKKEGADKSVIEGKKTELKQTTKALNDFLAKEKTPERTAYAREAAVEYQAQLQTAYRKRSVIDNELSYLDDQEANLIKYGLSGSVGSRARRLALNKATDEYMGSDDVKAQEESIRKNEQLTWEQRNQQLVELRQRLREEFRAKFNDTNVKQDELDRIATEREILKTGGSKEIKQRLAEAENKLKESQESLDNIKSDKTITEDDRNNLVQAKQREIDSIVQEIKRYKDSINVSREKLDEIIKDLESQKASAMRYGAVDKDDLKNDKYLKQNEEYNNRITNNLTKLKQKQEDLEKIQSNDKLTEKDREKKVKAIQQEINALNQENQHYETLIANRVKLMELHKQEKEESKQTPEERSLLATEKLVGLKQSLVQAEEKVATSKANYESAKGTENEVKMLEALDNQIKKRDEIQRKIADTEKQIERLGQVTQKTENAKTNTIPAAKDGGSGSTPGSIKEDAGKTGIVDLTIVEDVLGKILAVISGNGAVGPTRSADMDAKLARIKELEAKQQLANEQNRTEETFTQVENAKKETAISPNVANSKAHKNVSKTKVYKDVQNSVDEFRTSELSSDKEPLNAIRLALTELSKINNQNSQEYVAWQRKLGSALSSYGKKNGIENGAGYYDKVYADLEKKGVKVDPGLAITNPNGVSSALVEKGLVTIKEKEANAKQSEANAEAKITEEKKKQESIRFTRKDKKELNRLKNETKDYNPNTAANVSSGLGGLATENTLSAIRDTLNNISVGGISNSGGNTKTRREPVDNAGQEDGGVTELERRVGDLKSKFNDAISVGYLDKNNVDLAEFNRQLDAIENSDGTVEQLEEMRKKALALGDVVNKTVDKNKRMYFSTPEIDAATKQRTNMEARGTLKDANLEMVKEYNKAYDELIAKHKEFAVAGTLYDPNNQKQLQNMAIRAKDLGKQLETSVAEADQLQQLVNNSGMYNGKRMSGVHRLTEGEMGNVELSMRSYLQSLKLGNLEHIKFDKVHQKLTASLRTSNKTVSDLEVKYNQSTKALYAYQKAERESLTGIPAFVSGFKKKFNSIMQYLSMTTSIYRVLAELRKGIQHVRNIDLALTELKKVTDETEETYDKFLDTAAKTGDRLGSTISAVTEATATFAKLGYSMEQATELAESAIVYKNVGDKIASTEDAADSIISTMKGFKLEVTEAMRIVDRFNEVGNSFAITSQGIGEALKLSASALHEGQNSLDESIALITAANEVVNDPSSVGTALKTLTLRLRGSKTELEEMGEDVTDMATTTSQLQAKLLALTGGKVDIMIDKNTFKNSTQILREMAEEWENMTDIQRASALELMGGKRQANVLSAIIQNFDTVEKVIETSADSAGSALKENERYLGSIQGKIDQFNNAMQTMWSNVFDSAIVKQFVGLGTEIIKIVNTLGLIPSILAAILSYKLLIGAAKLFHLKDVITYIGLMWQAKTATELQGWALDKVNIKQILLNSTLVKAQIARMDLTAADLAGYSATKLLGLGIKGLIAGFKNLFTAMGPIGWAIIGITVALTAGIAIFNSVHKTAEELAEELSNFKSELQDIESDIDSLNSELKTTNERMTELLAKPSLSFIEQEELEELKQTTAELERQVKLKEMLADSKKDQVVAAGEAYIDSVWNSTSWDKSYYVDALGVIHEDEWDEGGVNTKDALDKSIESYKKRRDLLIREQSALAEWKDGDNEHNRSVLKKYNLNTDMTKEILISNISGVEGQLRNLAEGINMVFADENFDGLEYGMSDKINTFLDEMYAYNLKFKDAQGLFVKSDAISTMFDKTSTKEMQNLGKDLQEIADDDTLTDEQKNQKIQNRIDGIDKTSQAYKRLNIAMETVGVTVKDISDYFVLETGLFDSKSIEGVTAQYQKGMKVLEQFKGGQTVAYTNLDGTEEQIDWEDLFKWDEASKEATADADVIAKVLQGADEKTREQFGHLVETVAEGNLDFEKAIKSFGLSGAVRGFELLEEQISSMNANIFKDLGDELSGVIDTFSEFGAALESVANSMEILDAAQTQMSNSGRISVKTALDLINSTDQWNEVLKIENGTIQLVDNAEEVLIQTKLDHVKANLQAALSTVNAQLAQIEATGSAEELATTMEESTNMAVRSLAENMSYLSTLVGEFAKGNWLGAAAAADEARKETSNQLNYKRGTSTTVSTAELEERKRNIEAQLGMLEGIDTPSEFADNYDFEKTPGDKKKEDDAFKLEMDYWENRLSANQARADRLQNEIDLLEQKGMKASAQYYRDQMTLLNSVDPNDGVDSKLELLNGKLSAVVSRLKETTEGSEEWWEAAQEYNDIVNEIQEIESAIVDMQDAIGEIDTYKFEEFNTRLDNLVSKLETIRDLIAPDGEEDWFDDEGNWTEAGVAVLGSHVQQLEMYKQGLEETEAELKKYNKAYSDNTKAYYEALGIHSEQEYY